MIAEDDKHVRPQEKEKWGEIKGSDRIPNMSH